MSTSGEYTTVPLTLLDATKGNTDIVIQFSLVFHQRLSFEKLEESFDKLVSAWPIIAARIRRSNASPSGLEYHIPSPSWLTQIKRESRQASDPKRKQFYTLDEEHRSIASYCPDMSQNPSSASTSNAKVDDVFVTTGPSQKDWNRLVIANAPTRLVEYLDGDFPLATVQITRFCDATLVSMCVSHVIGDGFSVVGILKAWQAIMDGKDPPKPLQDLGQDPFLPFGPQASSTPHIPPPLPSGFYLFSLKEKLQFVSNFFYDLYIGRPESQMEQRYIFVPRDQVEAMEKEAKEDVKRAGLLNTAHIGKSDILYAWLMKNSHASLPRSWDSTPLTILNLRSKPPKGAKPYPRHDFWGAAYAVPLKSLKVGKIIDMPLGELALHIRKSLNEHSGADSAAGNLRFQLYYTPWRKKASSDFPFFSPPNHRWSGISDWRALKLLSLDFESAMLDSREGQGAPVIAVHAGMACAMSKRDRWVCIGDSKEGTWLTGHMSKQQWEHPAGFGKFHRRKIDQKRHDQIVLRQERASKL